MNARDKRALVLGGAILAGAILGLRVIPSALTSVSALHASARDQRAIADRARAVLEGRRAVEDSLHRALRAIVALAPRLVEGHSAAESQASLASLVSLEAGRAAGRVARLDALPDSSIGVFKRVSLRAELEGDIRGVVALVRRLETIDPSLSVTALRVNATDPAAPDRAPEVLRIELDIAGLYLPREAIQ